MATVQGVQLEVCFQVAEQMINPFGEDDDDYDINWLLDRHMAVCCFLVSSLLTSFLVGLFVCVFVFLFVYWLPSFLVSCQLELY